MLGVGFFHDVLGLDGVYEVAHQLALGGATITHPEIDFTQSDQEIAHWGSTFFEGWSGDSFAAVGFGRGTVAARAAAEANPNVFLAVLVDGVGVDSGAAFPDHVEVEIVGATDDDEFFGGTDSARKWFEQSDTVHLNLVESDAHAMADDSCSSFDSEFRELVVDTSLRRSLPRFLLNYLNGTWPEGVGPAAVTTDMVDRWEMGVECTVGGLAFSAGDTNDGWQSRISLDAIDQSAANEMRLVRSHASLTEALFHLRDIVLMAQGYWGADPRDGDAAEMPDALAQAWRQLQKHG